jgi:hypothetical protein
VLGNAQTCFAATILEVLGCSQTLGAARHDNPTARHDKPSSRPHLAHAMRVACAK